MSFSNGTRTIFAKDSEVQQCLRGNDSSTNSDSSSIFSLKGEWIEIDDDIEEKLVTPNIHVIYRRDLSFLFVWLAYLK